MEPSQLPVVVIGAGPVGLAAASHLKARGQSFLVLEAGPAIAANVTRWGHVRLFSPWKYLVDGAARLLLEGNGWVPPIPEAYPTGNELVQHYLRPLAALPELRDFILRDAKVTAVTRRGLDKLKTAGRELAPFEVRVWGPRGERAILARAVIDSSGTWQTPNPLGASGIAAAGEPEARARIFYGTPDVRGALKARYSGARVLVVGSGHSAFNVLLELSELAGRGTRATWAVRKRHKAQLFGGEARDGLAERGRLGTRVRALVESSDVELLLGFETTSVSLGASGLTVTSADGQATMVDEVIVATGFRPDFTLARELRLALDPAIESPVALAPLIDPNVHSCGTVPPHGVEELRHPERDFYIVGMKSYGRAPTFLLLTGYEQVRSVVAELAGDREAARRVTLVLPNGGESC